jgi:hypothetical protein
LTPLPPQQRSQENILQREVEEKINKEVYGQILGRVGLTPIQPTKWVRKISRTLEPCEPGRRPQTTSGIKLPGRAVPFVPGKNIARGARPGKSCQRERAPTRRLVHGGLAAGAWGRTCALCQRVMSLFERASARMVANFVPFANPSRLETEQ